MYSDQTRVETFLKRDLTVEEAENIDELIEAMSNQINAYTSRSWAPVGESDEGELEATERYFDGHGARELFVDEYIQLGKVTLLDSQGDEYFSTEAATDWTEFPANTNPKSSIRLRNYRFPDGFSNVKVEAVWGGGTPPADVIVACTTLVCNYINKVSPRGAFKKESIEGYSYELMSDAEMASETQTILSSLDHYKRILL